MVDRPILFSAPMVRALLDGRKTQTRRILKPQPSADCAGFQRVFAQPPYFESVDAGGKPIYAFPERDHCISPYPKIRFAIGDRLWVKETHQIASVVNDAPVTKAGSGTPVFYLADCSIRWPGKVEDDGQTCLIDNRTKRPSIFMPRWASRLTLTVTDVRVQRLQDISQHDACAEGVRRFDLPDEVPFPPGILSNNCYKLGFWKIWSSLHDRPRERWEDNPWVVAVSFDVRKGNIDGC